MISLTRVDTDTKKWHIPQSPFQIECSPAVLDRIRLEVEQGRGLPNGGQETGGVLFGTDEPGRICILGSQPIQCEHAFGPGFILSGKDENRLAQLLSGPQLNGLKALGWYHSHLRSKIFLSERDVQIHSRYFPAPYQIALVVRPRSDGPARAGFFFPESTGAMRTESAYEEFSIEAPAPSTPEPKHAAVPVRAESRSRKTSAKPEPQQTEALCPRCGSKQLRRSRRTGPVERFQGFFGFYPYRCHECLSRSFLKTSSPLLERARASRRKRPEERKRAWQRTRRETLLWSGGIIGFLAILYYLVRDTGPKQDQP